MREEEMEREKENKREEQEKREREGGSWVREREGNKRP